MLAIQVTINVFLLLAVGTGCILFGFILKQAHLQKKAHQILELEKEMLKNHAEIIELHKQVDLLKNNDLRTGATIFKLKDGTVDDEQDKMPDVIARKKLLGKTSNLK